MTPEQARERAIRSLLDVVEELVGGLASGQTPGREWAVQVFDTFTEHRHELADPSMHEPEPQP